jgi:hypothetical protein
MKPLLKDLTIEYDVITYQINHKVIKSDAVHSEPLVWGIRTIDEPRLIFAQINIKGAQLSKQVEYYYSGQEAQEPRLSALADAGVMASIDLALPTSKESSGVTL